jgi:exoribonuclease-2
LKLHERIEVRLLSADPVHGFIDFERLTDETPQKEERAQRKRKQAARVHRYIGRSYRAEVTGITNKATWIRTHDGLEGRLVRGWRGLAAGDQIDVILIAAESARGYIDFARE